MPTQQFATPRPVRLEIRVAAGDLHVVTVDGDESTVTLEGSQKPLEVTTVELVGDRLLVEQRRKSFIGLFGRFAESLHVQVRVPHRSRVEIVTGSGTASLEGSFGGLETSSASVRVAVTGEVAGDADVKTVSGEVRLPRVAGDLRAQTVSGLIAAEAVDGSVSMKSVSGDLRVGSVRKGTVRVQSVSGDVDLGIAAGTSIDVDAGTASGDLSSEVPLSKTPADATGPIVVIRSNTVSGDFRVRRAA
jgi:DUF4097 and DUF4098 domain-containing protein YvlB